MNAIEKQSYLQTVLETRAARVNTLIESLPEDQQLAAARFGAMVASAQVEATLLGLTPASMTAMVDHFKEADTHLRELELVFTEPKGGDTFLAPAARQAA